MIEYMRRVKAERERRGMTQLELSQALGVREMSVSRWERGVSEPTGGNLVKLQEWMGRAE